MTSKQLYVVQAMSSILWHPNDFMSSKQLYVIGATSSISSLALLIPAPVHPPPPSIHYPARGGGGHSGAIRPTLQNPPEEGSELRIRFPVWGRQKVDSPKLQYWYRPSSMDRRFVGMGNFFFQMKPQGFPEAVGKLNQGCHRGCLKQNMQYTRWLQMGSASILASGGMTFAVF